MREFVLHRVRFFMLALSLFAGGLVLCALVVDEGEVTILTTHDEDGSSHETQLWIVDLDGELYLRASNPDAHWLGRLERDPSVRLEVDGGQREYRAAPRSEAATRDRVNRAMAEKYGFADRLFGRFRDRDRSVPILLELLPSSELASPSDSVHHEFAKKSH